MTRRIICHSMTGCDAHATLSMSGRLKHCCCCVRFSSAVVRSHRHHEAPMLAICHRRVPIIDRSLVLLIWILNFIPNKRGILYNIRYRIYLIPSMLYQLHREKTYNRLVSITQHATFSKTVTFIYSNNNEPKT